MAAAIARARLADLDGSIAVYSAGTSTAGGQPASHHAAFVVADRGGSLSEHISRPTDATLMQRADLVLTMTGAQRQKLLQRWPELERRLRTLGAAAGEPQTEVADPFGGTLAEYETAYEEIQRLIAACEPMLRELVAQDAARTVEGVEATDRPGHPEKGNPRT
jgi:protein-tyrosine-phosphatase